MYSVEVDESGSLTRLHAEIVQRAMPEIIKDITNAAYTEVEQRLEESFHVTDRTGHYEASIVTRVDKDHGRVSDSDVVYGPWLEGVSRRNNSTPFKGYHAFRMAKQKVQMKADDIAQPVLERYIHES